MTVVANLVAKITADTTGFDKGVKSANARLLTLGRTIARVAGVGLGIGAGLAAFTKKMAASVDGMDDFGKRARLSAQDMFELQHVTEKNGVSLESFVQAISKSQVAAVKAGDGNKKLAEVFRKLGIDADAYIKLDTNGQIDALATGFSNIQSPALRSAVAVELFGRSGAALVPILEKGQDELKKTRDEIKRFGELSEEQVNNASRFDDAWGRLVASFQAIGRQIGTLLAGPMADMLDWIYEQLPQAIQNFQLSLGDLFGRDRITGLLKSGVRALSGDFSGAADAFSYAIGKATPQESAAAAAKMFGGSFKGITPEIKTDNVIVQTGGNSFASVPTTSVTVPDVRPKADPETKEQTAVLKQILVTQREGNRIIIRGVPAVAQ